MKKNSYGFTVVEMLVVIVIIAILATICIVVYTGMQDRARVATVVSDLSTVSKDLEVWRLDHGHYPKDSAELRGADRPIPLESFTRSPDPYAIVVYCANNDSSIVAARMIGSPIRWFAATSEDGGATHEVTLATPGTSSGATACEQLGMPATSRWQTWLKSWTGWTI